MILVTGASGCVGANLVHALAGQSCQIVALLLPDDPALALASFGTRVIRRTGDLFDPDSLRAAMQGVKYVYHAAGMASPCYADEARMWQVNVTGTRHLLQAAREAAVRRVVHVSSIAAVGYPDGVYDETSAYNGNEINFAYMHSKAGAEHEVSLAFASGLDVVTVCPGVVIAPWCDRQHGWGRIMVDVADGRLSFCPPGSVSWIGADDLAAGMIGAMQRGQVGERYLLCSGDVSYSVLIGLFAQAAGVLPPRLALPRIVVRTAARILALASPLMRRRFPHARMTPGVLELLWRRKHYRIDKAVRELDYRPCQSIESAVMQTWQWLANTEQRQAPCDNDYPLPEST